MDKPAPRMQDPLPRYELSKAVPGRASHTSSRLTIGSHLLAALFPAPEFLEDGVTAARAPDGRQGGERNKGARWLGQREDWGGCSLTPPQYSRRPAFPRLPRISSCARRQLSEPQQEREGRTVLPEDGPVFCSKGAKTGERETQPAFRHHGAFGLTCHQQLLGGQGGEGGQRQLARGHRHGTKSGDGSSQKGLSGVLFALSIEGSRIGGLAEKLSK